MLNPFQTFIENIMNFTSSSQLSRKKKRYSSITQRHHKQHPSTKSVTEIGLDFKIYQILDMRFYLMTWLNNVLGSSLKDNKKPSRSRTLEKTSQQFIFFAFHLKQSIFPFLFITGFDSQENCVYFEHCYYFLFAMKHTRQNTLHSNSKIKLKIFKMQNPAEDLQRGFERIQGFGTAKWFGAKWLEGWNVGVEVLWEWNVFWRHYFR